MAKPSDLFLLFLLLLLLLAAGKQMVCFRFTGSVSSSLLVTVMHDIAYLHCQFPMKLHYTISYGNTCDILILFVSFLQKDT